MWKIFERTGGDYSIVVARHWRARAIGLCCMVLTDDQVEGKQKLKAKRLLPSLKDTLQRAGWFQKKKENSPANWLRMLRSKAG